MNIQVEKLENQTARLTVTITPDAFDSAKKKAAQKLSSRYNIPGFRKGKAPYAMVAKTFGEANILEEAANILADDLYPKALKESQLEPYAAGTFEDFRMEGEPAMVFIVPLQPEVNLGEYRSVRVDYSVPAVTDKEVDEALKNLQRRESLFEPLERPTQAGDRLKVGIHSEFMDGDERPEENAQEGVAYKGDSLIHEHDAEIFLDLENEPFLHGFATALLDKQAGDDVEFELTIPADSADYTAAVLGRTVKFHVHIEQAEAVTMPALDDELAAKITAQEETPLTLEQLRERVRENMLTDVMKRYEEDYTDQVLLRIISAAEVKFPPHAVEERLDEMVADFEVRLKNEARMSLEQYLGLVSMKVEDLREQFRENAVSWVRRSLVLSQVLTDERIALDMNTVDTVIEATIAQYGGSPQIRQLIDTPDQRMTIANRVLTGQVMERIKQIGKGEAPSLDASETPEADDSASE